MCVKTVDNGHDIKSIEIASKFQSGEKYRRTPKTLRVNDSLRRQFWRAGFTMITALQSLLRKQRLTRIVVGVVSNNKLALMGQRPRNQTGRQRKNISTGESRVPRQQLVRQLGQPALRVPVLQRPVGAIDCLQSLATEISAAIK